MNEGFCINATAIAVAAERRFNFCQEAVADDDTRLSQRSPRLWRYREEAHLAYFGV